MLHVPLTKHSADVLVRLPPPRDPASPLVLGCVSIQGSFQALPMVWQTSRPHCVTVVGSVVLVVLCKTCSRLACFALSLHDELVCSLFCPRADCALFVVLIVRASPAWHQRSSSSEESPPKTTSDWHRGKGSGPHRVQTVTRTSRKSTSEYGMDLCMPHRECGLAS